MATRAAWRPLLRRMLGVAGLVLVVHSGPAVAEDIPVVDCGNIHADDRFLPLAQAVLHAHLQKYPDEDPALRAELGGRIPATANGLGKELVSRYLENMRGDGLDGNCYRLSDHYFLTRRHRINQGGQDYSLYDVRRFGAPVARRVAGTGSGSRPGAVIVAVNRGVIAFIESGSSLVHALSSDVVDVVVWRRDAPRLSVTNIALSEDYSGMTCDRGTPEWGCDRGNSIKWLASTGDPPSYEALPLPRARDLYKALVVTLAPPSPERVRFRLEIRPGGATLRTLDYQIDAQGRVSPVAGRQRGMVFRDRGK